VRYDAEVATADALTGALLSALGPDAATTLVVVAGDHGEAFGEHGEVAHSIFVYDTTLRTPLLMRGPGVPAGLVVTDPVSLVDVVPTVLPRLAVARMDADGVDVSPAFSGASLGDRALYAESFAPLLEFGWSALRTLREGRWKYIAAPRAELYDLAADAGEQRNCIAERAAEARALQVRLDRISGSALAARTPTTDPEAMSRLRSLGYVTAGGTPVAGPRPDPKDRITIAARLAQVTSGEAQGREAIALLEAVLRDDPTNSQAHLRLGYARLDEHDCGRAVPHFEAAIAARMPSADPYLGLAACQVQRGRPAAAIDTLRAAQRVEPDNPVVEANLGLLALEAGRSEEAAGVLGRALERDPDLHQARFALARALGRLGRRAEAAEQARELLRRLPPDAPQRPEVERLLAAIR
jgi:tetratricopeptide (TPR) repeat protein